MLKCDFLKKTSPYLFLLFFIIFFLLNIFKTNHFYILIVLLFIFCYLHIFSKQLYSVNVWLLLFILLNINIIFVPSAYFFLIKIFALFFLFYFFKKKIILPKLSYLKFYQFIFIFLFFILIFYTQGAYNDISSATINSVNNLLEGKNPYAVPEVQTIHLQNFMYPPAMIFIYLPLIFMFGSIGYFLTNFILHFIFIYVLFLFFNKHLKNKSQSRSLLIIFLFMPIFIYESFLIWTNDIPVLLFVLLSVFLFEKKKYYSSFAILSISFVTKIYPLIILPLFSIILFKKRLFKKLFVSLLIFLGITLSICLPFYFWDSNEFIHDMTYQAKRPLEDWEKKLSLQQILFNNYYFLITFMVLVLFICFF